MSNTDEVVEEQTVEEPIEESTKESTTKSSDILSMPDDEFSKISPEALKSDSSLLSKEQATNPLEEQNKASKELTEASESISEDTEEETSKVSNAIPPNKEIERIFKPFKANGKEIKVENVDDVISLMQMGANYTKKMNAIKPHLKLIKTLEKNGLLDEDKINFLIDLDKKNPEAIAKYLKDSKVDPIDIDITSENNYKSKSYQINDKEYELDTVLENIKESPKFNETLNIISNKFDSKSKQIIYEEPSLIEILNKHIEFGVYDQIMDVVEKERMLGKLNGYSDLEAYKLVGDAINAKGGFKNKSIPNKQVATNTNNTQDKIKQLKKATSLTKANPITTKNKSNLNILAMSDSDFEKLDLNKLL